MSGQYQKRICLFLDILGFSSLVKSQECNFVLDVIRNIKSELKSSKEFIEKVGDEPIATTFSDCIVLSITAKESDVEGAVNILVTATVKMLQDTYLNQKIALRGGISYGDLYHGNHGVFGPAMIKSYELESQFANWPRVIFDKSVISHLDKAEGLPSIGYTNYGDGFCGVDCLTRIEDILNVESSYLFARETGQEALAKLYNIGNITREKLEDSYGNPKVYSKYLKLNDRVYSLMKKFGQISPMIEPL